MLFARGRVCDNTWRTLTRAVVYLIAPFATAFDEVMDRDVAVAEKEMGELETRTRTALLQGRRAAAHEETKAFEELLDRTVRACRLWRTSLQQLCVPSWG